MKKELICGLALAVIVYLAYIGYDVLPLIMITGLGGLLFYLLEKKGILKNHTIGEVKSHHSVQFTDIGGQNPAKQEIQEALEFMSSIEKYKTMGIRPLKGILLTGPPGTGKTLLAKASATYTDSTFLTASGSEFIEMYAGVGAKRIRDLFKLAKKNAEKMQKNSAVIFIDEIEAIGGKRGSHSSHLEYDQTLNQLLVEMDGMKTNEDIQVLIMGATNRVDLIDDALLRPGRFDRIINVDLPDIKGRLQILKIHSANKPLAPNVELSTIAKDTFGFSGAQLENLCNEAAIYALREKNKFIQNKHLKEAIDKVMMGEKTEKAPSKEEKKRIAYHESGHALISEICTHKSVAYVTIASRGKALGYMRQSPAPDMHLYTKDYLEDQINIALAGGIAEEIVFGSKSSGSLNDFKQAVEIARQIINCGLSNLGIIDHEYMAKELMHQEIQSIIIAQNKTTEEILQTKISLLHQIADTLLEEEYISGEELREIMNS